MLRLLALVLFAAALHPAARPAPAVPADALGAPPADPPTIASLPSPWAKASPPPISPPMSASVQINRISLDDKAYADWLRRARVDRLAERVLVPLLSEFARENGIKATPEEIDAFIARSEQSEAEAEAEFLRQQAAIEEELKSANLAPSEREHLEKQHETLTTILGSKEAMEERARRDFGEDYEARMREIDEGIARETIVAWKLNKTLFDRYRGRVVLQRTGPEPLDAYAAFLADRKKAGAFGIYDAELEAAFWASFQDENRHNFATLEESFNAMQKPWWEEDAR
jgi:hypothetical protein